MTAFTTACPICGDRVDEDHDRVELSAELVPPTGDRPKDYWLHPRCWSELSAEWASLDEQEGVR
jgi:hypothetical protein